MRFSVSMIVSRYTLHIGIDFTYFCEELYITSIADLSKLLELISKVEIKKHEHTISYRRLNAK